MFLKNPKNEYRNSKQIQNSIFQNFKKFLSFEFVSGFGFRASCLIILTSCFMLLASTRFALAQDFATGINPPILQITADPPAKVSAPISITNQSEKNTTYGIYLRPFKASFEMNGVPNYDPELNREYEDFFKNVQINDGETDITEIRLSPGETKDLELRIQVGSDEPATDRYFTVVFLAEEENEEAETNVTGARAGIGTNVLLSIGPRLGPKGRIAEFTTPRFTTKGPIPFRLELANHNDYFVESEGTVVVRNMFGQIVGALEFGPLNILASSNRLVINNEDPEPALWWNEEHPIGVYKAEVRVALSEHGPLLVDEIYFFAFPLQLVIVFTAALFALVWLIRRARRRVSDEG